MSPSKALDRPSPNGGSAEPEKPKILNAQDALAATDAA